MLVRQEDFVAQMGEYGYLVALHEEYDWPEEVPFGWRCGPVGLSAAIVLPATDTGPVRLTLQVHDAEPKPEATAAWQPAEEISLHTTVDGQVRVVVLGSGDFREQWPEDAEHLRLPAGTWVRMRLYCSAGTWEPGLLGDREEHHLLQLWVAPEAPPVHPEIGQEDVDAREFYATEAAPGGEQHGGES